MPSAITHMMLAEQLADYFPANSEHSKPPSCGV